MPGFDGLARFVGFCEKKFYTCFRWLLRKKQAKGYGVHSPFAYNLITNVIYSPYSFYAFSDIYGIVSQHNINPEESITTYNHLSFRLIHYLQAKDILEVNSGIGINTLFLVAPSKHISCICVEEDREKYFVAADLQRQRGVKIGFVSSLSECQGERFDAIFINFERGYIPDMETLTELSHSGTFWVLHPIKKGRGKQFWHKIVHDLRARMTFDVKDTGIVFLRPDFHKENYLV